MSEDTLSKYGPSFQSKVISALITDTKLMDSLSDIIFPKFFDSDANRWVVETILEYHREYRRAPTLDVFKVELNKVDDAALKKKVIEQLRTAYVEQNVGDLEYIKTEFSDFCRNQNLKEVIIQSVDLLKAGQYDRIKDLVDKAMKVGVNADLGSDYVQTFIDRISDEKRDTVETGWGVLDEVMGGGLGPGELGVVVAPSGVGKTWWLSAIGAAAVKAGKTVVHYTLELSENYVGQRYDTIFTHIPTVNHQDRKDEISDKIGKLKGKLLIKYFPPKGVTTRKLEAHIDKMIASGHKPDLIIIDYADLMLTNSGRVENTYAEQGGIYIDLRGMGGEYGIPIWTASQTQRSAIDSDVIEADKIADSYAKVMNADFIISISRKSTDKLNNTARVYVMKNRFGPDGITFPSKMNTNDGFIEVYDSKSSDGILAQKEASNGKEVERKLLHKKYVETMPTANLNELG
jgi:replicative DNA helicase